MPDHAVSPRMEAASDADGRRLTVLAIDDDPAELLLIELACEGQLEVALLKVDGGEQAQALLTAAGVVPDLVLLDINMPRMDGFDVLRWIKDHPRWRCTPVVMLSNSVHESDVQRAYAEHASSFLQKPSSLEDLIAQLRALLAFWTVACLPPTVGLASD